MSYISKKIRPELDVAAFVEGQETGHRCTTAALVRELLAWAFDQYRKAGSLRRLKSARLTFELEYAWPFEEEIERHKTQTGGPRS